jgi:NADH:ubiquinone oxidoreductase subunit 5 (subunit L)/multisubunit Na+/H+ antiporter MnhA subunit
MPTPALLLLLATFLPLLSFGLLLFLGRRMGDPIAAWLAIAFAAVGFALSMGATIAWYNTGEIAGTTWGPGDKPILLAFRLFPIQIDTLTIAMFNTITPIIALASGFSLRFLHGDKKFHLYFTWYQLLTFSTLGLVLSRNLVQILIFWTLVGVAAFFLARLGKPSIGPRALVVFTIDRIGDAAFFVFFVLLYRSLGNVVLPILQISPIHENTAAIPGLALFFAAAIRTTQYLFRAPIPAAAILQSATFAASGVYVIARFLPIFTPTTLTTIAIVGVIALAIGAIMSLRAKDLISVISCSTLSQFGLIYMALGLANWVGALFLLLCHAFFKSFLMFTAGAISHAANGERRLAQLGGLYRKLPVCAVLLAIGTLVISGAPFTSGYYSTESILSQAASVASSRDGFHWLFFVIPTAISIVTAVYMTRCWMLVFWGIPRSLAAIENVRERTSFWFPLAALAVLSLIGGSRLMEIDRFVSQAADEADNYREAMHVPPQPDTATSTDRGIQLHHRYATWPFAIGILTGFAIYSRKRA